MTDRSTCSPKLALPVFPARQITPEEQCRPYIDDQNRDEFESAPFKERLRDYVAAAEIHRMIKGLTKWYIPSDDRVIASLAGGAYNRADEIVRVFGDAMFDARNRRS